MLNIDEIRQRLEDRNLAKVAAKVGVTRAHLSALKNGTTDGSVKLLQRLSDYLEGANNGKRA